MDATNGFAAWLRVRMRKRRVKQKEVADQVGVSPSTVSRWLKDTPPELENVQALAGYFKVGPEEIIALLPTRDSRPSGLAREIAVEVVRLLREQAADEPDAAALLREIEGFDIPDAAKRQLRDRVLSYSRGLGHRG